MNRDGKLSAPATGGVTDSDILKASPKVDCRVIFIVGPSGIGKSTVLRQFIADADVQFKAISLDQVAVDAARVRGLIRDEGVVALLGKVGPDTFFMLGITELFRRLGAALPSEIYLVDVGSGFQGVTMATALSLLHPVIGITASEEAAFRRFFEYRSKRLSFNQYTRSEYSRIKREVYASALHSIDTTNLSLNETVVQFENVVKEIANINPTNKNAGPRPNRSAGSHLKDSVRHDMKFLDFDTFKNNALENPGDHWTNYEVRWPYYSRTVEVVRVLGIDNPSDVLEMGTMGVSIVQNCKSIDYDQKWDFKDKNPTYLHDARSIPWPVETKAFKLFIALRVFQHLAPVQKKCFLEAKRIAENVLIVVPNEYNEYGYKTGITLDQFIEWNDGEPPVLVENVLKPSTFLYLWKFGPQDS